MAESARFQIMPLGPGTRLGPYEIQAAIGAGGMGEVYRARDSRLQRDVAIKVLPAAFSSDPERLARFEQEGRAAAALNHPNILAVYDLGTHDGAPYIVSELLEGDTLRNCIGGLSQRKTIEYAIQIASGLAAAHDRGIAHRDLKPENIFITADGRVKILDFGLAKLIQAEPATAGVSALPTTPALRVPNTMAGVVLGTEGYMSPEQVRGLAADHRSDIFAFGAILYEMLSGRRAFHGDTTMGTMMAIAKDSPLESRADGRDIPPGLARIVERCLEKNPATRFQSVRDLAFALEGLSSHSGSAPAVTVVRRVSRERIAWLIAVGALAATAYIAVSVPSTSIQPRHVAALSPEGTRVSGSLALSPDGRTIVFEASKADGSSALYAQTLDAADAKMLSGTENASYPFFSPDGLSIAFFAEQKLKRVNLSEGAPQTIAAAPDPRGGTWNSEDAIVFAPNGGDGLYRVSAAGGAVSALTHLDPTVHDASHRWPRFLPDGRHFVFLERTATGQDNRLFMVASSIDNPAQISRIGVGDSSPVYHAGKMIFPREGGLFVQPFDLNTLQLTGSPSAIAPDAWISADVDGLTALGAAGDVIAFRRAKSEERQLEWVDAEGRQLGMVGPVNVDEARLSPDGRLMAIIVSERLRSQTAGLWLMDLARGATSRFTPTPRDELHPVWSPDGSRIAFSSDRLGNFDLYLRSLNAGDDTLLLKSSHWKYPDDWSSNGKWLLYEDIDPTTKRNLHALPMTGTPTPIPVVQSGANEWFARFSPDGRWVAYTSDESGREEIYVQSFPSATKKYTISTAGGSQPAWRRDGRVLYYLSGDNHIMRVDIAVTGATVDAAKPARLFQVSLSHRSVGGAYWWFDPTADGSRFIVAALNQNARASAIDLLIGQR